MTPIETALKQIGHLNKMHRHSRSDRSAIYADADSYRQAEIIRAISERGEPPRQATY